MKEIIQKFDQNISFRMGWVFNFCTENIINDQTNYLHRKLQCGAIILVLTTIGIIQAYYKINQKQQNDELTPKISENSIQQSKKPRQQKKSFSIKKISENSSVFGFSSPQEKDDEMQVLNQDFDQKINCKQDGINQLTLIVGHYSLATTFTIMYSPELISSILTYSFVVLSFALVLSISFSLFIFRRGIFIIMIANVLFLFVQGYIGLSQTTYNFSTNRCFSQNYH